MAGHGREGGVEGGRALSGHLQACWPWRTTPSFEAFLTSAAATSNVSSAMATLGKSGGSTPSDLRQERERYMRLTLSAT